MNTIFLEDCRKTLVKPNLHYDYVFCVPPDYDELGLEPIKNEPEYDCFLREVFALLKPMNKIITIAITDRKYKSGILPKHIGIIETMKSLGYRYVSQKIWCKSYKQNLYRLNYSFVMTFSKYICKQNHIKSYEEDVWNNKVYKHKGYPYAIALEVVKRCIANFTKEGDVCYDPFMGSGTTAISCLELDRKYIGSEINEDYYNLSLDRINRYHDKEKTLFTIGGEK